MRPQPAVAHPPESSDTTVDPHAVPVDETLAAARNRAANRKARWESPPPAAPTPKRRPAPSAPPARGRVLKCRVCGRTQPRSGNELRRLARGAWPMCCGQVMPPVPEPAAEPCSVEDADELPWADRRVTDR